MRKRAFLDQGMFSRQSLKQLILPLVAEQFLVVAMGMANTIMVASVGEAAVSAVSLVEAINILFINVFASLATGGAVVISQYLGRREQGNACQAAKQLIYSTAVFSLFIMALCLVFNGVILKTIFGSVADDVSRDAQTYFYLSALSYPFMALYNAGAALYRSTGNSKVSMFTSIIANVINISGNIIFIYVLNWEVAGAGVASLIARAMSAVVMLILAGSRNRNVVFVEKIYKPEFNWDMIKRILNIGVPSGIENGIFQIGRLMVQGIISTFGTVAIAGNAIANTIAMLISTPGQAIGMGLITVVGQCMGAREHQQVAWYTRRLMLMTYLFVGAMAGMVFLLAPQIAAIYNLSAQTNEIAVSLMRLNAVGSAVLWPCAFPLANMLRAAGDAKFTMVVSIVSMWVCRFGLSYVFAYALDMGVAGVWVAMLIDWLARSISFLTRVRQGKWKRLCVVD
ncbi:MAG: MATE family efflux transporter [Christensenellales bacterium]|jgi:putative MATE family efflux protein